MIFYGDSITHGVLATTPTKHYTMQLAEALNADWINKGLSSDVFRSDFATYKDSGVYEDPDYIVVAYGTNHLSSKNTLEYEQKRIGGFFENLTATYPDATIFVVTPIWRKTADDTQDTSTYVFENLWAVRDLIKSEIADYENVIAIDGTYLVPHDTSYYSDGLHPNDLGFAEYSKNIIAAIKSALGISE